MRSGTQAPDSKLFDHLPKDYLGLCRIYLPRPLHDPDDYASACQAIQPLVGFSDSLTADQLDYIDAVSTFIEAYDESRVKWKASSGLDTLRYLLEQQGMTAADLSRLLEADRSLGPKILRGERRLTLDHIRTLSRHWNVKPELFF